MKNKLKSLAKRVLMPLRLRAAAGTGATIQTRIFGLGMITLITSNEEMDDIMKIVKYLEDAGLLIKVVSKTIQNETKNKKVDFSACY